MRRILTRIQQIYKTTIQKNHKTSLIYRYSGAPEGGASAKFSFTLRKVFVYNNPFLPLAIFFPVFLLLKLKSTHNRAEQTKTKICENAVFLSNLVNVVFIQMHFSFQRKMHSICNEEIKNILKNCAFYGLLQRSNAKLIIYTLRKSFACTRLFSRKI